MHNRIDVYKAACSSKMVSTAISEKCKRPIVIDSIIISITDQNASSYDSFH